MLAAEMTSTLDHLHLKRKHRRRGRLLLEIIWYAKTAAKAEGKGLTRMDGIYSHKVFKVSNLVCPFKKANLRQRTYILIYNYSKTCSQTVQIWIRLNCKIFTQSTIPNFDTRVRTCACVSFCEWEHKTKLQWGHFHTQTQAHTHAHAHIHTHAVCAI